ncbi:uncharacterized protein LOC132728170, partial [Ruditapes philippinarum]|uniref:uncharacterized protein LOC132728170 n=1 Tax=Ruditapes philippinarum TaxID=129788 RepID=UPI00295B020A
YGLVKREKQNIFLGRFFIDFEEKALIRQKTSDLKYVTEKSTPITDMPQLGDDVVITVRNKNSSNMMSAEINFYKNSELIASSELSNHSFLPFIEAVEKVEESPEILVYPQYIPKNTVSLPAGWQVGMKLEALDVKTPNLICVATVERLIAQLGKLFDSTLMAGEIINDYWDMRILQIFHPIGLLVC